MVKKMSFRRTFYRIIEKALLRLHKPYMNVRIKRLRAEGAKVGNQCKIFTDLTLSEPYLISIGNNVTISTNCTLLTHDNSVIKFMENATDVIGKVTIGSNCFIGANTVILPGVSLADGTIVGAGSVVSKSILDSNCVIAGNPARIITSTENLKQKYRDNAFNLAGMNKLIRKQEIVGSDNKLICR